MPRLACSLASLALLMAVGCGVSPESLSRTDLAMRDMRGQPPPPPRDGMMGSMPCRQPQDCMGACSPMARGCTCAPTPMGFLCVPTCFADADCPPGPMGPMFCRMGVCMP